MSTTDQFRAAIAAAGLAPPDSIIDNGKFNRFSTNGKRSDTAGWYVFHGDSIPSGTFGCHRSGLQSSWSAVSKADLTDTQREQFAQRRRAALVASLAAQKADHDTAAIMAKTIWDAATPISGGNWHAYLETKGIQSHGARLIDTAVARALCGRLSPSLTGVLLAIQIGAAGQLRSLQFITEDGTKRPLTGGEKKGCHHVIGKPGGTLLICEGFATGCTLNEATGHAVVVALDAGNLANVALAMRAKFPSSKIIMAADDDHLTEGNPGLTYANEAARAVGGFVAKPQFPAGRGSKDTDFNDLYKLAGAAAVKAGIDAAIESVATLKNDMGAGGMLENQKAEDEFIDNHRNAPRPDPACLYGLVGDVARAGGDTTEANPYAVAANFIAFMGCSVGRGPYMPVGNTWHHSRMFMLHIGRSGRGRKGDAVSLISRIERALKALSQEATPQVHRGGLSSREGLVYLIHDGFTEGKTEVEAIHDKRLLVVESEFANVLHQSKRDGNTLSAALRDCWDGVSMKPATKSSRLWATDPHIALIGAVTPSELLGLMVSRELTNGFANRFLMFWAERSKILAFPIATSQAAVDALAVRVLEVLTFCQAERWVEHDHMRVSLSQDARKRYERLYLTELNDNSAGERITPLIERRAPMLLRLAMLFSLCDLTTTVEVHHINAALAWIRYSVDSIKFIFGSAADEVAVEETNDAAQKIAAYLGDRGQATRSELTRGCFGGHVSKSRIDAALDELLSTNPPLIVVETAPRAKSNPGNATKIYKLSAKCAKSAKSEHPCGLAADFGIGEVCEVLRSEVDMGPSDPGTVNAKKADFADFATLRNDGKRLETRMDIETSHSSHTSHAYLENEVDTVEAKTDDEEVF